MHLRVSERRAGDLARQRLNVDSTRSTPSENRVRLFDDDPSSWNVAVAVRLPSEVQALSRHRLQLVRSHGHSEILPWLRSRTGTRSITGSM